MQMIRFSKNEIQNGIVIDYLNQSAIAHSAEEAERVINTFRRGKGSLECNTYARRYLAKVFSGEELVGNEVKTTGCGPDPIRLFPALAPTIEGHQAVYNEICRKRKEEELSRVKRMREEKFAIFTEERRGWYNVTVSLTALTLSGNRRHLDFSGNIIANSMMDAFGKLTPERLSTYCAEKELILESYPDDWFSSNVDITYIGTITD